MARDLDVTYRIGTLSAFFLITVALFLDVLGFLLILTVIGSFVTEILGITGSIFFFVVFLFMGVNYLSGKSTQKIAVTAAGAVIEMFPFLNGLPSFTVQVSSIIYITRKEDREKAEKKQKEVEVAQARAQAKTQQYIANATRAKMAEEAANDEKEMREAA